MESPAPSPSPLWLLIRVNTLQIFRRMKSTGSQSSLLIGLITLFIAGYALVASALFYHGLRFVSRFPGLGEILIERLIFLLFAFLFVLLLFSNIVISYTNQFRNRETNFLLALPVPFQTIFRWKFIESTVLASWAFLLLIAPLLGAHGLQQRADWSFFVVTPFLVGAFIILPAVFGSWLAVLLARHLDRRLFQLLALLTVVTVVFCVKVYLQPQIIDEETLETRVMAVMDRLLTKTRFCQFPFLPSYWLSNSLLNWVDGAISTAFFFVLVLVSHVLFFGVISFTKTGRAFYSAVSATQSRASTLGKWPWLAWLGKRAAPFHYKPSWLERTLSFIPLLRSDTRALLLKDSRIFWRDTSQWGQTLMLFGLLGAYIVNLRYFRHQLGSPFWIHLAAHMNLGACALNLATLTTRFVYPQFSLEGKRIWIVGMAPIGLVSVVKIKLALATAVSLLVTLPLVFTSCHMLQLNGTQTLYFAGAISAMAFTLNSLAIGMGVIYPNLREDNPSKIVSGFGGTFCLVMSFVYIVVSVIALAISSPWLANNLVTAEQHIAGWLVFTGMSLVLGVIPLRIALRRAAQFEH